MTDAAVTPGLTATAGWSAPAVLSSCGSIGAPRVLFPDDKPYRATGPGGLVWAAGPRCPAGAGARVAEIGGGDIPGAPLAPALNPRKATAHDL